MTIDILFNVTSDLSNNTDEYKSSNKIGEQINDATFDNITSKYKLDFKQRVAFEIMACSFVLRSMQDEKVTNDQICSFFAENEEKRRIYIKNYSLLMKNLKEKGGMNQLIMFLSGMGGTGKSEVIKAFVDFTLCICKICGWRHDSDVIKIAALTGTAACEIPNGTTLHRVAFLNMKNITPDHKDMWKTTKILIIDEVSFLDVNTIAHLDKHLRLLKNNNELYGDIHIVFVGDFFQLLPVKSGKSLAMKDTIQFGAINKAVFLNKSHRFKNDPQYGEIMRRLRVGMATKEDIQLINTRFIRNKDVQLPSITKLRCACIKNEERCAYNSIVFLRHLEATHTKGNDYSVDCPNHTCIIKSTMRYKKGHSQNINMTMYNRIIDECGDCDIKNGRGKFVDPALKFFHNIPLMMNTNDRIDEELANGTPCVGLYIKLKPGCSYTKENWEGYMVNTVYAHEVEYIVCKKERTSSPGTPEYFTVKPQAGICHIRLPQFSSLPLLNIYMTYLPINCNISTTGHKLQGKTLNSLVVNSWTYQMPHWIYVVLSRVRALNCLVLNEKLDESFSYKANAKVLQWEKNTKETVEKSTFKDRGQEDYKNTFLKKVWRYNYQNLILMMLTFKTMTRTFLQW